MQSTEAEAVRGARIVAILGAATLVLAACGDADPDEAGAQERIDELEAELEEARQDNEELLAENERLHEELRLLAADDPDDEADDDTDSEEPDETDAPDDDAPDDPPAAAAADPQPIRTAEGLNEQLRLLFERDDGPDEFEPGTTGWTSATPPDGLEDDYDTPGDLAFALAAALDAQMLGMDSWETTTRVLIDDADPDMAYVAVLSWGFADDSIAGRDLRMTITASDGTWSPGGAEERFHCRRGVSDDLCV